MIVYYIEVASAGVALKTPTLNSEKLMPTPKQFEIKGDEIVVRYKISPRPSKSKKSTLLASSEGRDSFVHDGKTIYINFNAYTPMG